MSSVPSAGAAGAWIHLDSTDNCLHCFDEPPPAIPLPPPIPPQFCKPDEDFEPFSCPAFAGDESVTKLTKIGDDSFSPTHSSVWNFIVIGCLSAIICILIGLLGWCYYRRNHRKTGNGALQVGSNNSGTGIIQTKELQQQGGANQQQLLLYEDLTNIVGRPTAPLGGLLAAQQNGTIGGRGYGTGGMEMFDISAAGTHGYPHPTANLLDLTSYFNNGQTDPGQQPPPIYEELPEVVQVPVPTISNSGQRQLFGHGQQAPKYGNYHHQSLTRKRNRRNASGQPQQQRTLDYRQGSGRKIMEPGSGSGSSTAVFMPHTLADGQRGKMTFGSAAQQQLRIPPHLLELLSSGAASGNVGGVYEMIPPNSGHYSGIYQPVLGNGSSTSTYGGSGGDSSVTSGSSAGGSGTSAARTNNNESSSYDSGINSSGGGGQQQTTTGFIQQQLGRGGVGSVDPATLFQHQRFGPNMTADDYYLMTGEQGHNLYNDLEDEQRRMQFIHNGY